MGRRRPDALTRCRRAALSPRSGSFGTPSYLRMANSHEHPGQAEPRSYGQTHHEKRRVNLNTATIDEIADLPMVGRERAEAIMNSRPFRSWEDVERIPGFSTGMIDDLQSGGAEIGS